MINIKTQKNGLQTLLLTSPGTTAATVQIWFRAGSSLEDSTNKGIAHFLEHMFFKGTATRPGAKIAREVESFGGEINAFTSFDYTCYYINCPSENTDTAVKILLDMVSNPLFSQKELIPERDVVFEEFRRAQDSPQQFSFMQMQKNSFAPPYNSPILGNAKTIKNFTRKQLTTFRNKFYNQQNALLIVAGDFRPEKIEKSINQFSLPKGKETSRPIFKLKKSGKVNIHQKDVGMASINITLPCPSLDAATTAAEDIAISALAYGESSPLFYHLVTQNSLANSCAGSTMIFNGGGFHNIRITTPDNNIPNVLNTTKKIIDRILKQGFDSNDLQKIKNQYIAAKIYEQESLEYRAFSLGSSYAGHGSINKENEYIERLKKVTLHQLDEALRLIFTRNMHINIQLPLNSKTQKIKTAAEQFKRYFGNNKKEKYSKIRATQSNFDPQVKLVELRPGIKLLYRYNNLTPTFVMHAYLKGGLSGENINNNGIFGLISNSLTKGNKHTDLLTIKTELEQMSASLNNFTGKNAYGLTMHGLTADFEKLSYHFFNSLIHPLFEEKTIEHEKELALRALINRESDPAAKCFEQVAQIMFPEHPYSRNTLGTPKSLKQLTANKVKTKHFKQLKNSPLLITYCGDLPLNEVVNYLAPYIAQLKARPETPTPINIPTKIFGVSKHLHFDREQTQIFIGIPTFPLNDKRNIILKLLTTYLSGQSSELFVDVRDKKGLCYSVQPVHFKALEAGYWGIYMASGHDKVDAAQKAILDILNRLTQKAISQTEFKRIKKMIKGQEQINVQTNDDYANIYSIPALHNFSIDWHHQTLQAIEQLTYNQFKQMTKDILNQDWNIITAGRN